MGGRDKLAVEYEGKTLFRRAVELLDSLPVHQKILVTTRSRLEQAAIPPGILTIINTNPETGQSRSLRLGLEAAACEWYLFLAADQPLLTPECLRPLLDLTGENPGRIIFPFIDGSPCTPALFPAHYRDELLSLSGDTGGREVRAAHPEACMAFEAANPECFIDIDSEEDFLLLGDR